MRPITLFVLLLVATFVRADEPVLKVNLREYMKTTGIDRAKKSAAAGYAETQKHLAAVKRARVRPGITSSDGIARDGSVFYSFSTAKDKQAKIDDLTAKAKEHKQRSVNPQAELPVLFASDFKVGAIGIIRGFIAEFDPEMNSRQLAVIRVISDGLVVRSGTAKGYVVEFVLRVPTAGIVDGAALDAGDTCFEVTGTTMVSGETMFDVRPFDVRKFLSEK
jgi:hypothetical protein